MANEKRLDLVDRAKVYDFACAGCTRHGESPGECYHNEPCERLIFAFTVAEPVDAVEVVHGRWETVSSTPGYLCCSQCKDVYILETWPGDGKWNYCPNCGAHMDAEEA